MELVIWGELGWQDVMNFAPPTKKVTNRNIRFFCPCGEKGTWIISKIGLAGRRVFLFPVTFKNPKLGFNGIGNLQDALCVACIIESKSASNESRKDPYPALLSRAGWETFEDVYTRSATADDALFFEAYVNKAKPARAEATAPNTMPELLVADSAMREK